MDRESYRHCDSAGGGVTVVGTGSAGTAVDQVVLTLGVEVVRPDAGDAFRMTAATATAVLGILADDGVDSRSVRTEDLSLAPRYEYRDNEQQLVGYQAVQRLVVTLTGLNSIDRLLTDVVTRAGEGVRIDGVRLSATHPDEAMVQARQAAYSDAAAKAGEYAEHAGRTLGRVVWIQERERGAAGIPGLMRMAGRADVESMPVATGDTTVSTSIAAHWDFAD